MDRGCFAVDGDNVVVNIGNEELVLLDLEDGTEKWRTLLTHVDFVKAILIINDVIVISGQTDLNQAFITIYGLSDGGWITNKILGERTSVTSFACDIAENVHGCTLITPGRFLAIQSTGDFRDISQELPSRYYVYLNSSRPQRNWLRVTQEARTNRSYGYDLLTQQEYFLEPPCNRFDVKGKGLWLVPDASLFFFIDGCGQLVAHPTAPDNWQQPLWVVEIPDLLIEPVIHESEIILLTKELNLLVYEAATGEQTARFSFSPQIIVNNARVVAGEDTIFVYLGRTLFAIKN
ncbi:MAG: hypothetical protein IPL28_23340 [Chloroflexi bacterium]|nr:hypothetical protein [Chloroflexota bacterium]